MRASHFDTNMIHIFNQSDCSICMYSLLFSQSDCSVYDLSSLQEDDEEPAADTDELLEKLQTITEIFDQKNDDYLKMEEQYEQSRKVSHMRGTKGERSRELRKN